MADSRLLTADQLADRLGLEPSTVKRWGRLGKVPRLVIGYNLVRYRWSDVLRKLRQADDAQQAQRTE